jgi:prolyl-tRNA synthetase
MVPPAVARLSRLWFPSGGIAVSGVEDAHSKLIRAGFLRQSNAGMFHMLPLGRRVQDKVEGLVASHIEELLGESWFGFLGPLHAHTSHAMTVRRV